MTRVKLACEYDMCVVYSGTPGIALPAYKLRYGLGMQTTLTEDGQKQQGCDGWGLLLEMKSDANLPRCQ